MPTRESSDSSTRSFYCRFERDLACGIEHPGRNKKIPPSAKRRRVYRVECTMSRFSSARSHKTIPILKKYGLVNLIQGTEGVISRSSLLLYRALFVCSQRMGCSAGRHGRSVAEKNRDIINTDSVIEEVYRKTISESMCESPPQSRQ
jgi:hypothetical protein